VPPLEDDLFDGIDLEGLDRELRALRNEAVADTGPADLAHLRKLELWGRLCTAAGYATAWGLPNPLSMLLLSTGSMARWTIVAHHITHKAMDRVPGAPARLTSAGFAKGRRRLLDWFDWLDPEAWSHEHNVLHHAYTNEVADPDLVEQNLEGLRTSSLPQAVKLLVLAASAATWKITYYAPNTLQVLQRKRRRKAGDGSTQRDEARGTETTLQAFDPRTAEGREVWRKAVLPYALGRFVALPAAFAALGPLAVTSVFLNSLGAELLTNLHTFAIITPNHAGDDLKRFSTPPRHRKEWFARQVLSSANCATGGDLNDFLHGFLNYQIEHHLFPDLSPRQYQRLQPRVKAVCEKYGVPYRQESVFARLKKMVAISTGRADMQR
jgi:fatty acid desaturase